MKAATGVIISFVWMLAVFLVGFITISSIVAHANDSKALTGDAATNWTNFVSYMWIAVSLLALTPLIMVILVFAGLFGQLGGSTR